MLYNDMFFPVKLPLWKNLLYVCMTARLFSMKRFSDRAIKLLRSQCRKDIKLCKPRQLCGWCAEWNSDLCHASLNECVGFLIIPFLKRIYSTKKKKKKKKKKT